MLGWESTTAKVLLGFSLSAPTVMYYHHFWSPYMSDPTYLLYLAPLLIAPIAWGSVVHLRSLARMAARQLRPDQSGRDPLVVAEARR